MDLSSKRLRTTALLCFHSAANAVGVLFGLSKMRTSKTLRELLPITSHDVSENRTRTKNVLVAINHNNDYWNLCFFARDFEREQIENKPPVLYRWKLTFNLALIDGPLGKPPVLYRG